MSSLITDPTPQFINPFLGNAIQNGRIYVGVKNSDAFNDENWQTVYLLGEDGSKIPVPQPLRTNGVGVIEYQGMPASIWVDDAYSITILGENGNLIYQSFYVDDPTYWLRQDLATPPTLESPAKGVGMVAGAAPIESPHFTDEPTAPTPPTGDSSDRIATTEFVETAIGSAVSTGVVGSSTMWLGSTVPANALLMDGSQVSKDAYPELYAIIGDVYATANGLIPDSAMFFIPDARGCFLRGADNGAGRSQYAAMLTYYGDMFKSHGHTISGLYTRSIADASGDYTVWHQGFNEQRSTDASGGTETMPMTLTTLPIVWATSAATEVVRWWNEPRHISARPTNFHLDQITGELIGTGNAMPAPRDPGVWLCPAHATHEPPPAGKAGHVLAFRNGAWLHDAALFQLREQAKADATAQREVRNAQIAEREQRRAAMDAWLKQQGAPFGIEDLQ